MCTYAHTHTHAHYSSVCMCLCVECLSWCVVVVPMTGSGYQAYHQVNSCFNAMSPVTSFVGHTYVVLQQETTCWWAWSSRNNQSNCACLWLYTHTHTLCYLPWQLRVLQVTGQHCLILEKASWCAGGQWPIQDMVGNEWCCSQLKVTSPIGTEERKPKWPFKCMLYRSVTEYGKFDPSVSFTVSPFMEQATRNQL